MTDVATPAKQQQQEKDVPVAPDQNGDGKSDKNGKKHHHHRIGNGNSNGNGEESNGKRHHHRRHKKSRHLERLELFKKKDENGGHEEEIRSKKIHVRSKDPSRIARQFEKESAKSQKPSKGRGSGKAVPPMQKIEQICKICGKEPYLVERIVAEKSWWHKNCFRCKQCNKVVNLDTYMSHEGVIYCKPHHKELFQPKVAANSEVDMMNNSQEAILRHKEQERRMETIVRESKPVELGDDVVRSSRVDGESKYAGLEDLDVGSKFQMFEDGPQQQQQQRGGTSSDRYGIMEKLKRLQEGADLDDLLAEMEEELPSDEEDGEEEGGAGEGLTEVQKRAMSSEKLFGEQEKRNRAAERRRKELRLMRSKILTAPRDQIEDLLNASANKIKKTTVDVRSENAKKFRDMFDRGQVPEAMTSTDRTVAEKEAELELMRKGKREQRDYFRKLEEGRNDDEAAKKEPKLLVGRLKDKNGEQPEDIDEDVPEMASLSSRFSFFEHHKEKEEEEEKRKRSLRSPTRLSKSHVFEDPLTGEENEENGGGQRKPRISEVDHARRECKARSVLNKFKEMEQKVLNGEEEVGDRRPLKRFTPPPRRSGSQTEEEYYDSDESDSYYSGSSSYTSSDYTDDEEEADETLRAIREAARAKDLRAKFEKWETSQDAQDQGKQIKVHDENGASLETAGNLKARFEALQVHNAKPALAGEGPHKFQVRRFK